MDADYWIRELDLKPHPEGGYYRETYRAGLTINTPRGPRAASTAIYFLLEGDSFSAFHRIAFDEMWHFYAGSSLSVHQLDSQGVHSEIVLSGHPETGEALQAVVPAGMWFASCPKHPASYSLVGCTVAPGFDFDDFELAGRSALTRQYPQHRELIHRFTR